MRAAVIERSGEYVGANVRLVNDWPEPVAGPGQVRVRTEDRLDAPAWGLELWRATAQNLSIEPAVRLAGIQNGQTVWLSVAVGQQDGSGQALAQPVLAESDLRAMLWNPPNPPASSPEPTEQEKKRDDSTN